MINNREYIILESETSNSFENLTTELTIFPNITTTIIVTNTTIFMSPKGLSDGAVAGIVIGTILGVIGLVFLAFIIYKYRQRLLDMLHKDSKKSNNHIVQEKLDNPRPNITFAPDHEYLTVNTCSPPKNQQSDGNIYVNI